MPHRVAIPSVSSRPRRGAPRCRHGAIGDSYAGLVSAIGRLDVEAGNVQPSSRDAPRGSERRAFLEEICDVLARGLQVECSRARILPLVSAAITRSPSHDVGSRAGSAGSRFDATGHEPPAHESERKRHVMPLAAAMGSAARSSRDGVRLPRSPRACRARGGSLARPGERSRAGLDIAVYTITTSRRGVEPICASIARVSGVAFFTSRSISTSSK